MTTQKIHPTAIIDKAAELGEEVEVGPYAIIGRDTRIGAGCRVAAHVVIHPYTTTGQNCRFHSGAVIGDLPQDHAFDERCVSFVEIGNDCVIREGVTIHRGTKENTVTKVGDHVFLMAFSHLAHNVQLADNVILANNVLLGGYVEVDEKVFIGGGCGVHQFVKIGKLAMLGGNSGLSKDVPPYCTVRGVSLNDVAGLNAIGMKRAGIDVKERAAIKKAFNLLFCSGLNTSLAIEQIKELFPEGPASEFWKFHERSNRGFCPMKGHSAD
jgi:UDP-N-acetylglucosamine acyltransferase